MAKLFRSAAYRISATYAGAFALCILVLGVATYIAMHIAFIDQLDSSIAEETHALVAEASREGDAALADAIAEREAVPYRQKLMFALFAPDGKRIAGSMQAAMPPLGFHDIDFADPAEGPDVARGLAVKVGHNRRLVVAADREWIEQIDDTVVAIFAIAFLAVLLLQLAGAWLLGSYLRRRLESLNAGAQAIIAGDIRRRMPVGPRGDEFDRLAETLNAMLARIEGLVDNLRQVSGDLAHDLRTPISALRNYLEGAKSPDEKQAAILDGAVERVDALLKLFAAILRISEIEGGEIQRFFQPVDLSGLATDIAESFEPALRDSGHRLSWTVQPRIEIEGDRELLAQALINLIENAQRHTPPGTAVTIDLRRGEHDVELTVADSGPGVPADQRDQIAGRFVRLDRSRSTAGHGLGLNLVSAVAALHGGTLAFGDNRPGLVARMQLNIGKS